jgi:hypothetical protein
MQRFAEQRMVVDDKKAGGFAGSIHVAILHPEIVRVNGRFPIRRTFLFRSHRFPHARRISDRRPPDIGNWYIAVGPVHEMSEGGAQLRIMRQFQDCDARGPQAVPVSACVSEDEIWTRSA